MPINKRDSCFVSCLSCCYLLLCLSSVIGGRVAGATEAANSCVRIQSGDSTSSASVQDYLARTGVLFVRVCNRKHVDLDQPSKKESSSVSYFAATPPRQTDGVCRYTYYSLRLLSPPGAQPSLERTTLPAQEYANVAIGSRCPSPISLRYVGVNGISDGQFRAITRFWQNSVASIESFDSTTREISNDEQSVDSIRRLSEDIRTGKQLSDSLVSVTLVSNWGFLRRLEVLASDPSDGRTMFVISLNCWFATTYAVTRIVWIAE
jgi:hypothetical protein